MGESDQTKKRECVRACEDALTGDFGLAMAQEIQQKADRAFLVTEMLKCGNDDACKDRVKSAFEERGGDVNLLEQALHLGRLDRAAEKSLANCPRDGNALRLKACVNDNLAAFSREFQAAGGLIDNVQTLLDDFAVQDFMSQINMESEIATSLSAIAEKAA